MTTTESIRKAINEAYRTPLFKDLSDERLRVAYWSYRELAHNNAAIASSGSDSMSKCANQMGTLMKNIQIIEAIARKRGISLAKTGV